MVSDALFTELRHNVDGEVHHDRISRALYATDASPYQIDPVAVVVPRTTDAVRSVLEIARKHNVPIVARGAATSLAGQTVGQAIQIDFSKYLNHVLELNADEGWVRVQPGIVLDHLNGELAAHGLKFAPDVAPSNRATIGGMIANNSSGAYSLHYGKTIDHVLELRVLLSDGSETTLRPLAPAAWAAKCTQPDLEGACYRVVSELAQRHRAEIERRYPKIMRRVGGYNLDAFVDAQPRNLSHLIVGSEGTLALILEAKLRLVPRPAASGVVLLEFADLFDALDAVVPCLECAPVAVELLDDLLLDLSRRSLAFKDSLAILKTEAAALLLVEFFGDDSADVAQQMDRLLDHLQSRARVAAATRALTAQEKAPIWLVRKAGLPLLQSMSPGLKPETCVEDSAVPPEHLSAYIRRFKALIEAHGTIAAFYGHASVGLLHVRPLLNLHDPQDVRRFRALSVGIRDLVLEYGGAISGEHGDGLLRSEHNQAVFGSELYAAFQTLKHTFDPRGLLNPGKIVDAPPLDSNLRYVPPRGTPVALRTHFRFGDTEGMLGAAELCNGNAACRKTDSGTMCPSYMVTRDEAHSTRGRANALRLALSGALPTAELWSDRMHEVLDLCIECKGCTAECPSRVNMTRLKSEWLAQYYTRHGTPLRSRLFGHIRALNDIGARFAPFANRALRLPGVSTLSERLLGISRYRSLPRFASPTFEQWFAAHENKEQRTKNKEQRTKNKGQRTKDKGQRTEDRGQRTKNKGQSIENQEPRIENRESRIENREPRIEHKDQRTNSQGDTSSPTFGAECSILGTRSVVLFPDTFTLYNDPQIGIAATQLLEALGYTVLLPQRLICCGRPAISKGLLGTAKRLARAQLEWLAPYAAHGLPIVGLEPSCLLTFRDEYLDLLDDPRAEVLRSQSFLLDEFLSRELRRGAISAAVFAAASAEQWPALVHGHCHQKALAATAPTLTLLRAAGFAPREVDSGCCGMAGSFGYEREHYEISLAIGERALLPAVRATSADAVIVAMGTSCRQQIAHGTGRTAQHIAEVLWARLVENQPACVDAATTRQG
jgi:FAD/FMN-containing dehydrogenase/Fe-S oxidoreductase